MSFPLDRIKGSIPPLFTPFRNGEVDYDTYARLIEFQIKEGSHGILVNGTTSEPASLTIEERNRLVTLAMEIAKGRVPVVAATGSQSLAETKVLTAHAVKAGVDALLIVTPYYSRPPQRGIVAVLPRSGARRADAVDDLSHPRPRGGVGHGRHGQGARRTSRRPSSA